MDIIPISEMRNTSKVSEYCVQSNAPLFVTKNGSGHLVIQSYAEYMRKEEEIKMLQAILESERLQARNGNETKSLEEIRYKFDSR